MELTDNDRQRIEQENVRLFTFEDFRKELIDFALAYHKAKHKDIANDASEWATGVFDLTNPPKLEAERSEVRSENEYLKQLLKCAADMLPAYVGPPEKPEINTQSQELFYRIQDAINSLKTK